MQEVLTPPKRAHRLTVAAAMSPVVHPPVQRELEHDALEDSSSTHSSANMGSSLGGASQGDGAGAQWLVLDSLGGAEPVAHAVLHPPPEVHVEHEEHEQEGQGLGGAEGNVAPVPQHHGAQGRGTKQRKDTVVGGPNEHPMGSLVDRFVAGQEAGAAAQRMTEGPASSETRSPAGAAGAQKEEPVRGRRTGVKEKGKRTRQGRRKKQQPDTMEGMLAGLGLPPEVADALLSAVQQGKVAKYITPSRLDRLLRRWAGLLVLVHGCGCTWNSAQAQAPPLPGAWMSCT